MITACAAVVPGLEIRSRMAVVCSHSPLSDSVGGEFDLPDEQREVIAAEIKEKARLHRADYLPKYYQKRKAEDPEGLEAGYREAAARSRRYSRDLIIASGQRHAARAKASRTRLLSLATAKPISTYDK